MRFEIISDARWLKRITARGSEQIWYRHIQWEQPFPAGTYVIGHAVPDTLALLMGAL